MKILVTCQYYWPDNFLINEVTEELVKRGHKVTVLTGLPDYSTTKVPKEYKWGKKRKESHNGVEIIRVPIIARRHGFIMRVINYLSYFISSSVYARTHNFSDYDVIYAYQLAPVLMVNPAMIIKKKYNIPMFMYVLDLWPDQMKIWHVNENNPIFKIVLKYCKKAYGSGDIVGITSKPFKDYLINVCSVDKDRIVYLPQHSNKIETKKNHLKNDKVNFIFAGNVGQQQNMHCLIDAIGNMKTKKEFVLHIYGDGTSLEDSKNYTKDKQLNSKIIFHGRVPKEELKDIYSKMDAFVMTLCSEKDIGFVANTVPAKLQGYMSAGKPIFASIDGAANEIIKESKCGKVVSADDSISFAKVLDDYVENPANYKECGINSINYFNKNFEKEKVISKLEDLLVYLSEGCDNFENSTN